MQSHRKIMLPLLGQCPSQTDDVDQDLLPGLPLQSLDAATPVHTPSGVQRLDAIAEDCRILTRSGTFEPVVKIDRITLTKRQLQDNPDLAPIRFDPGALPGLPEECATLVSPDCPIAWAEDASDLERFPARAFCDGGLIRWVIPEDGIHYIRLHFATAQQICVSGIWVELGDATCPPKDMPTEVPKQLNEDRYFRPLRA